MARAPTRPPRRKLQATAAAAVIPALVLALLVVSFLAPRFPPLPLSSLHSPRFTFLSSISAGPGSQASSGDGPVDDDDKGPGLQASSEDGPVDDDDDDKEQWPGEMTLPATREDSPNAVLADAAGEVLWKHPSLDDRSLWDQSSPAVAEGSLPTLTERPGPFQGKNGQDRDYWTSGVQDQSDLGEIDGQDGATCPGNPLFAGLVRGSKSKGLVPWRPQEGKFLILQCGRGQISNAVLCISNHLLVAGLLNRTLIVPSRLVRPKQYFSRASFKGRSLWVKHYDRSLIWDLTHTQQCYGPDTVILADEVIKGRRSCGTGLSGLGAALRQRAVSPDKVVCWRGPHGACKPTNDSLADHVSEGNCPATVATAPLATLIAASVQQGQGPVVLAPEQLLPLEIDTRVPLGKNMHLRKATQILAACLPRVSPVEDFLPLFRNLTDDVSVLGIGDLVNHEFLEASWVYQWGGLPFLRSEACPDSLSLTPPREMHEAAASIRRELLGGSSGLPLLNSPATQDLGGSSGEVAQNSPEHTGTPREFLCVHWRRGDFKQYCLDQGPRGRCWYSPAQAAKCAVDRAREHGLASIFLATNARDKEMKTFANSVRAYSNGSISTVRLPSDSATRVRGLSPETAAKHADSILVTLDKLVCSQGKVFLGSTMSTFSADIQRLRFGLGTAHCADSSLCRGQKEWRGKA